MKKKPIETEPSDNEIYKKEIECVLANRHLSYEEKKKKVRQLIEQSGLDIEITIKR